MADVEQTRLPGVGVRHDFTTHGDRRVGVILHRGGTRELVVYAENDPDTVFESVRLDSDDSFTLAELLGGSRVTEVVSQIRQSVEGLSIDWLPIGESWWCSGRTIADSELRRRTGVSIVAIIREDDTVPSPGPEQVLVAGDTVVVVGTPEGIEHATALLQREGTAPA